MFQILLPNAFNAWKSAISFHDKIEDGFFSLEYQKSFVSSLHNSVELFLKQIMIDNNDNSVAKINKKSEKDANLELSYSQSNNLNEFFRTLSADELNRFYSIGFTKLKDKANELLEIEDKDKQTVSEALKLLQTLRNNETHFYINSNEFLSEKDFVQLHNFMVVFFQAIAHKNLLPCVIQDLRQFGLQDNIQMRRENRFFEFDRSYLQSFSYKDALINNDLAKEIKAYLIGGYSYMYATLNPSNSFKLAEVIVIYENTSREKFYDIFVLLSLMNKYQMISLGKNDDGKRMIKVSF